MKEILKITKLPGFQTKAKIGKIYIKEGKTVAKGDIILTLEGAKGNLEVKADHDFKVIKILLDDGDEVVKDSDIAEIEVSEAMDNLEENKKYDKEVKEQKTIDILADTLPGYQKEAKVGKINKNVGEEFFEGESLLTLEGAKCNAEVEAKVDGEISSVEVKEGDEIKKGSILFKAIVNENLNKEKDEEKVKETKNYHGEVVVLGGGPGGYVAAIRASQRGKKTIIIEEDNLGGTCLNRGCIPTKSMVQSTKVKDIIDSAEIFGIENSSSEFSMGKIIDRKNNVVNTLISGLNCSMQKHDIEVLKGRGKARDNKSLEVDLKDGKAIVEFDDLILAPGSKVAFPPFAGAGLADNLTSDDLLELREIPKSLIILGGRVIAMEFAFIYKKLGTDVTVIQRSNSIFPNLDDDVIDVVRKSAIEKGINLIEGTNVKSIKNTIDNEKIVEFEQDGEIKFAFAEKVAVATGREPNLEGLELEKLNVEISDKTGGIKVDEYMKTTAEHIYAIGDATNIYNLAHVASKQGLVAVENILGNNTKMEYFAIPEAVFTDPEIGLVGMNEKMCKKENIEYIIGKFPYMANGKALVENETEGFVKVIARKDNREIIGASLIGTAATDLLSVFANLVTNKITIDKAKDVVYAHPTVSETVFEAILDLDGESLHK